MSRRFVALSLTLLFPLATLAANWPQWRGPAGDGTSPETDLPLRWSEAENIRWKCPLPDAASTPAVWGDAVFTTGHDGDKLLAYRINAADGSILWTRQVGTANPIRTPPRGTQADRGSQKYNRFYRVAAPSPATDGEVVIFHFGTGDLAAYDFDGRQHWSHNLQKEHGQYTIWYGHANSPVIVGDVVISVCMQDSLLDVPDKKRAESYVIAHDKKTGAERWKTPRMTGATAEHCDAYTTPLFHVANGKTEVIVVGGEQIDAYDPTTGKQLWYLPDFKGNRTITGPTIASDVLYTTGGMRGPLTALKLGGAGKLSPESILWQQTRATPDSPSPVVTNGLVFWVSDNGIASCADAKTGELKWSGERLPGEHKASPLAAAGRVYFLSVGGKCTVVKTAAKFEKLAENPIGDETIGSIAAAAGRLYIRGKTALYCVGN
jgi:outer membrane protein assembly factor BamB